ncbi:MAG: hypothetical protein BYD32DRAFT_265299 [Podila humilis]|nr:MAG: hypothetical protein BYD32DRAFT_265299 [Podila humilis]
MRENLCPLLLRIKTGSERIPNLGGSLCSRSRPAEQWLGHCTLAQAPPERASSPTWLAPGSPGHQRRKVGTEKVSVKGLVGDGLELGICAQDDLTWIGEDRCDQGCVHAACMPEQIKTAQLSYCNHIVQFVPSYCTLSLMLFQCSALYLCFNPYHVKKKRDVCIKEKIIGTYHLDSKSKKFFVTRTHVQLLDSLYERVQPRRSQTCIPKPMITKTW